MQCNLKYLLCSVVHFCDDFSAFKQYTATQLCSDDVNCSARQNGFITDTHFVTGKTCEMVNFITICVTSIQVHLRIFNTSMNAPLLFHSRKLWTYFCKASVFCRLWQDLPKLDLWTSFTLFRFVYLKRAPLLLNPKFAWELHKFEPIFAKGGYLPERMGVCF